MEYSNIHFSDGKNARTVSLKAGKGEIGIYCYVNRLSPFSWDKKL